MNHLDYLHVLREIHRRKQLYNSKLQDETNKWIIDNFRNEFYLEHYSSKVAEAYYIKYGNFPDSLAEKNVLDGYREDAEVFKSGINTLNPSPLSILIYWYLLKFGIYVKPEFKVNNFYIDLVPVSFFPIYFKTDMVFDISWMKIAIECDGKEFHSSPEQLHRDREREEALRELSWSVYRFTGSKIWNMPYICAKQVHDVIVRKTILRLGDLSSI